MLAQFAVTEKGNVRCQLCPHSCLLEEGEAGICRVRRNESHLLISLNYGKISAVHLDPIEKKPLCQFMPGTDTYSIGSFGCNLRCPYCQNYPIAMETPATVTMSPEEVVGQAVKIGCPSISYTYNEPIVSFEFVQKTASLARKRKLANILVTNGFINPEPLQQLLPLIDAMNIDLKAFSDKSYKRICGGQLAPVLETIRLSHRMCHVEITTLLVTGMHTLDELERMVDWLSKLSASIPLHVSRYFPHYHYHEPPTPVSFVRQVQRMASRKLDHVYAGNLPV